MNTNVRPLAIRMHAADNVAIIANDGGLPVGTVLPAGVAEGLVLRDKVPQGHKVALVDLAQGQAVMRYNVPVGYARQDIPAGSWVHERLLDIPSARELQGLPMASMTRSLRKAGVHVVFDVHFVIQKEHSFIDRMLTRRALSQASSFVVHAGQTFRELKELFPDKPWKVVKQLDSTHDDEVQVVQLFHPVYDLYRPIANLDIESEKKKLGLNKHVFLFFGFIRKYKGLDLAIEAFAKVCQKRNDVSFLICGESFWHTLDNTKWSTRVKHFLFGLAKKVVLQKSDDEREYAPLERIKELGIEKQCVVFNRFIGNEELPVFFQVSDAAVLFYRTATPSGIESLSYNFKLPKLASRVGHFPETNEDGFNGYLADAGDTDDMARIMLRFLDQPIDRNNVVKATENMSWANFASAIAGR
jgi:glycosyltransferase involved in cell wall biosynthesis